MNPLICDNRGIRPYVPRRRPWRLYAVTISLSLLAGMAGGYHLAAYQTRVALENVQAMGEGLLQASQRIDHPKRTTTRTQAAVIVAEKGQGEP